MSAHWWLVGEKSSEARSDASTRKAAVCEGPMGELEAFSGLRLFWEFRFKDGMGLVFWNEGLLCLDVEFSDRGFERFGPIRRSGGLGERESFWEDGLKF